MKLNEAIKQIFEKFGKDTLKERRLVSLLADYTAFTEYPALQKILTDFVKGDYDERVLELINTKNKNDVLIGVDDVKADFKKNTKYKEDLVDYCFDCILYGFGVLDSVNEPYSFGFDAYSNDTTDIIATLPEQLKKLKNQYITDLDRLATKPEDLINEPAGYYTVEAQNKLYLTELKIQIVADAINEDAHNWCEDEKNNKLSEFKNAKDAVMKKEEARLKKIESELQQQIDILKNKYKQQLEESLVIPGKSFLPKSAYIPAEAENLLEPLEKDINDFISKYNLKDEHYCENVRKALLDSHSVDKKILWKHIGLKIILPGIVAIIVISSWIFRAATADERAAYASATSIGDKWKESGNFDSAFFYYEKVYHDYPQHRYRTKTEEKVEDNAKAMQTHCYRLIEQKQLSQANIILNRVPEETIRAHPDITDELDSTKVKLSNAIEKEKTGLTDIIYNNKGRLNEEGKAQLEDLLKIDSTDYWLNFIKKKEAK